MSIKQSIIINKSYDPLILRTILKRYWWWPLTFVLLFGALAFFYLRYTKPLYESDMVIQLASEDNAKDILDIENINMDENEISQVVELLRSELLFERAIRGINLNVSLYSRGKILTEEMYLSSTFSVQPYALLDSTLINKEISLQKAPNGILLTYEKGGKQVEVKGKLNQRITNDDFDVVIKAVDEMYFDNALEENELFFVFNSTKSVSERLISGLTIMPLDVNAKTISISFRGYNSQLCHDLTNAVAAAFISFDEEQKRRGSENVLEFIDIQLDSLSSELKSSKDSLMYFQRRSNLPDPESVGESITENISKLQDELFEVEEELGALINAERLLKSNPNRLEVYRLLPEMLGKSYEMALVKHIEELHTLLERKEDLLYKVTEENTEVRQMNQKIDAKIAMIQRSIDAIFNRLKTSANVLKGKVSGFESDFFELPEKKMEFNRLKNIQDLNEKYFTLLMEKKVLYEISDAGYASANRILKQPKINQTPVAPNRQFIYGSFMFLGLIIGLGVMLLKYLTFNEINMVEDLEAILPKNVSILGGVPLFRYHLEFSQLIVSEAPKSSMAESMRKIRTNLSYINPNYKTIAISSSISGEGKTFVALNLGGIIAMSGKRTILLDLDMRKPKIHLGLNADNTHGMSSLIVGQSTLEQCIKQTKVEFFDFITAGPIPPNPSELILSDNFKKIVDELKELYDVVIIDNPPVGLVSDGVKNLTEADIPIYVFKSHYSKRNFAYRVKELFEMQQLKSLNVILNGVQSSRSSIYGYGYGDGYVDDAHNDKFKDDAKKNRWYRKLFRFGKK
jgi:capsular exopolysaccharide synthesis family protein